MAYERKKKPIWEPTNKIKPPDGIKSSDYTNVKPFIPSYEKDPTTKMAFLMSHEYAKIWHREKEEMEKQKEEETKKNPPKKFSKGINSAKKKQKIINDKKEKTMPKKKI